MFQAKRKIYCCNGLDNFVLYLCYINRKKTNILLLIIFTVISISFKKDDTTILDELFHNMEHEMSDVSTLQFNLKRTERIDGKIISVENYIRFQSYPFKSMIQFLGEKEGDYLIYMPDSNDGKALYIPGGFPYINVNLEPTSYLMRRTSHYTVEEIGVKFIIDQIKGNYEKWKNNFHYRGVVTENNIKYHKIEGLLGELTFNNYKVKKGEKLSDIGKRCFVSEYMLMERNDNIDDLYDDLEGEIINIPTCYANRIVMHVNTATFFPEMVLIEDDRGLFEQYEYKNIIINQPIEQKYFSEKYLDGL